MISFKYVGGNPLLSTYNPFSALLKILSQGNKHPVAVGKQSQALNQSSLNTFIGKVFGFTTSGFSSIFFQTINIELLILIH